MAFRACTNHAWPLCCVLVVLLLMPAAARAQDGNWCRQDAVNGTVQQWTCQWGPIGVGGYEVKQDVTFGVPKPDVDGAITHMDVDVTDPDGTPVPIRRLMLHHIVFLNIGSSLGGAHDRTCNRFTMFDPNTKLPAFAERFYAAGEERAQMNLPSGYGYPTHAADKWGLTWMFMNHRLTADSAYVRYHATIDTAPVVAVHPYWLDVNNCQADPIYSVPGGGPRGSVDKRTFDVTLPEAGRIVAGGGHVHGGARELRVSAPSCGDQTLLRSRPAWGLTSDAFYHVKPVLHEPGPIAMSESQTATGISVAAGEQLRLTASYDNTLPHTRVMGIYILYLAPDASAQRCGPLPPDLVEQQTSRPHRTRSPRMTIPLTGLDGRGTAVTIARPAGATRRLSRRATIAVGEGAFDVANARVKRGTKLTWRFESHDVLHNITVASGPRGFASPNLLAGRAYSQTLDVPGTYKLFCALHPVSMTETVTVDK